MITYRTVDFCYCNFNMLKPLPLLILLPMLLLLLLIADDVHLCTHTYTFKQFNCLRSQLTHTQFSPHTIITKCNTLFSGFVAKISWAKHLFAFFTVARQMKSVVVMTSIAFKHFEGVHAYRQSMHIDQFALSLSWYYRYVEEKCRSFCAIQSITISCCRWISIGEFEFIHFFYFQRIFNSNNSVS